MTKEQLSELYKFTKKGGRLIYMELEYPMEFKGDHAREFRYKPEFKNIHKTEYNDFLQLYNLSQKFNAELIFNHI